MIGAAGGDEVELGPTAVTVNGIPSSRTAAVNFHHHPLSHAPWGRHRVAADDVWLFSTGSPEGSDSRYVAPVRRADIRATARAVVTMTDAPGPHARAGDSHPLTDDPAGSWPWPGSITSRPTCCVGALLELAARLPRLSERIAGLQALGQTRPTRRGREARLEGPGPDCGARAAGSRLTSG